jgi:hypothetical protein
MKTRIILTPLMKIKPHSLAPPIFPRFAPFDQSITFYVYQFNNSVDWYYDSAAQAPAVGQSLYVHSKGQHDEICTGVKGHEKSDEPCSLLASSDSWRYVIYPESGECCRFCNTTDYCGIVAPDWLQQNATFVNVQPFGSLSCDGWVKQGGEQNFYYADLITRQPCEYYEACHGARTRKREPEITPN